MTGLLEMKEKLKLFYSRNEVFILPIIKFLVAFVTFTVINGRMGYMMRLDKPAIVLIAALLCSFLPFGCIILFAAVFSLLHMYTLSMEVALVGLCLYLVLSLLFFRFSPKESIVVLLTPLAFTLKIPYVMPIAMGLLGTPASAVSIGCGVLVYFFLNHVIASATAIGSMDEGETTAKLKLIIDGMIGNKQMFVLIGAFASTVIVVYLIRRMSVDYAWTIAIAAGAIIDLVLLLVGDLLYDTNMSLGGAIFGTLAAIAIAKVIEFFRFCVDYSRTEKVQFEDDEYYYYVKAVPKMSLPAQTKTVKKINSQRRTASARGSAANVTSRDSQEEQEDYGRRMSSGTAAGRSAAGHNRSVVTERTGVSRSRAARPSEMRGRNNSGQRVSINSNMVEETDMDNDYEQWE